jgi:hypothetical protein
MPCRPVTAGTSRTRQVTSHRGSLWGKADILRQVHATPLATSRRPAHRAAHGVRHAWRRAPKSISIARQALPRLRSLNHRADALRIERLTPESFSLASHAEGFHLRVLLKPCVNLSIHTASDVRLPTLKKRQWGKSVGLAHRTRANHSLAPQCRRLRRLNFHRAQRTR